MIPRVLGPVAEDHGTIGRVACERAGGTLASTGSVTSMAQVGTDRPVTEGTGPRRSGDAPRRYAEPAHLASLTHLPDTAALVVGVTGRPTRAGRPGRAVTKT